MQASPFSAVRVCAGIDAVGWQPPEKSKRISASQTPRHQSRMSGPGHDRPGHRSGSKTTKSNDGEFSIEHMYTAASADAVLPSRPRHSRYMLCTTTVMYPYGVAPARVAYNNRLSRFSPQEVIPQ